MSWDTISDGEEVSTQSSPQTILRLMIRLRALQKFLKKHELTIVIL